MLVARERLGRRGQPALGGHEPLEQPPQLARPAVGGTRAEHLVGMRARAHLQLGIEPEHPLPAAKVVVAVEPASHRRAAV